MGGQAQDKLTRKGRKGDRDPGRDKQKAAAPDRNEKPNGDGVNVKAKATKYVPL